MERKVLQVRPRQVEEMGSRWSNIESWISGGRVRRACLGDRLDGWGEEVSERSIAEVRFDEGAAMFCYVRLSSLCKLSTGADRNYLRKREYTGKRFLSLQM